MDIGLVHRTAGGISCEFISGLFLPEQPSSKRPAAAAAAPPLRLRPVSEFYGEFYDIKYYHFY